MINQSPCAKKPDQNCRGFTSSTSSKKMLINLEISIHLHWPIFLSPNTNCSIAQPFLAKLFQYYNAKKLMAINHLTVQRTVKGTCMQH
jgi:hypothetical protein